MLNTMDTELNKTWSLNSRRQSNVTPSGKRHGEKLGVMSTGVPVRAVRKDDCVEVAMKRALRQEECTGI